MKTKLAASIVLFNTNTLTLKTVVEPFLNAKLNITLYLIDNSPSDILKDVVNNNNIVYIHNPSNPGFGAAHNLAIKKSLELGSNYHFIVNPDIFFKEHVILSMVKHMEDNSAIGMMMPQILNLNGSVQFLPKLLPSPLNIVLRKFKMPDFIYKKIIDGYELRFVDQDKIYNSPLLSGCFTLLNLKAIEEIGLYDDNFFMYFEDWDLSRRMHQKYKTIYYPLVSVYHGYESGANKSFMLFKIFVHSAFTYFNKWGWFFDGDRIKMNKEALAQFK